MHALKLIRRTQQGFEVWEDELEQDEKLHNDRGESAMQERGLLGGTNRRRRGAAGGACFEVEGLNDTGRQRAANTQLLLGGEISW